MIMMLVIALQDTDTRHIYHSTTNPRVTSQHVDIILIND